LLDSFSPSFLSINKGNHTYDRRPRSADRVDRLESRPTRCDDVFDGSDSVDWFERAFDQLSRTVTLGLFAHGECAEW
jgi:hypothetical protein